jgi:ABC-type polysaccharide transport system permease subunit
MTEIPPPPPPPPPPLTPATPIKRSRTGFIITVIGTLITLVAAVIYLAIGNATPGIVGILFVILIAYFLLKGRNTADARSKQLAGLIPFFIGWIILILVGTVLAFDPVVLVGGLLLVMGGVTLATGK